ncbi:deleted in malignant brain tumors 1 protein-like [Ctenopharyngodon idella]|uniref:deleted in malignant brain tumors 1 protein-like n=1 Tax=Ctenopharyngodon idella TaxID=7959 RepID=UPI0022304EE2|nr:deleted in malignant brain tumors 1 protein-like [Ctenopharyngodon idella]
MHGTLGLLDHFSQSSIQNCSNCSKNGSIWHLKVVFSSSLSHFFIFLLSSVHVNVRLVGGHNRCAGRVEVHHRGQWGTVCDEDWDLADAAVVCRELDCGEPVDALSDAHFGPGSGPIWKSYVMCKGSESMVEKCGSGGWEIHNCDHSKDAGVICSDIKNVRLVNGTSRCAGRVEIHHRGQWGTVCGVGWDLADAAVVCRELDCGEPVDALDDAHFGLGSRPVLMKIAICTGSESTLKKCGYIKLSVHDECLHKSAQVICSEVRLVGESRCSGRLEILDDQSWVSVCAAAFDQQDAEVVCRELDCGAPVQVLGEDAFGKGDAQMWTQEIQCRGNESQIHLCPTSPSHKSNCSHEHNIGLLCTGRSSKCNRAVLFNFILIFYISTHFFYCLSLFLTF